MDLLCIFDPKNVLKTANLRLFFTFETLLHDFPYQNSLYLPMKDKLMDLLCMFDRGFCVKWQKKYKDFRKSKTVYTISSMKNPFVLDKFLNVMALLFIFDRQIV